MFNVSSLLLDDALKPATPLTNGAISGVAGLSASSSSKANILNIVGESLGLSSTTFTQCAKKATEFAAITQNNGHYAVQGHSKSPIFIPIESPYATSY